MNLRRYFPRVMLFVTLMVMLVATPMVIYGKSNSTDPTADHSFLGEWKDFWLLRLAMNLLGYATIIVPGYLIIQYAKKKNIGEHSGHWCIGKILRACVHGDADRHSLEEGGKSSDPSAERTPCQKCLLLCFCAAGLQGSYLTWGLLQERIMAHEYGGIPGVQEGENFKNSQFLVFMNRILALVIGALVVTLRKQPRHFAPIYKYSYSSFSNIMSSWCQYEALKFVSFPTQVLAKASKIIPVMLMGKVVSKSTYHYYEYCTAVLISVGVSMFLLTSSDSVRHKNTVTTFSGVLLLIGYLAFDAFTANWQGKLFQQYKMSSIQMMVGVNTFSVLFTAVTLFEQGGFIESIGFMAKYPTFMIHVIILSTCSASGQLFIFFTIAQFGPVTFTIIMTLRQGLAILLSCLIYHHPVTITGVCGILIVFAAIFTRIYCNYRIKKAKKAAVSTVIQDGNIPEVITSNGKS